MSNGKETKVHYDKLFRELEGRSYRAYFLSHSEARSFENKARLWEIGGYVSVCSTVIFGSLAILGRRDLLASWKFGYRILAATIGTCSVGSIVSFIEGSSKIDWIWETNKSRTQKHIQAAASWLKIHRLANLYREMYLEQQQTGLQETEAGHHTRYSELLDLYFKASSFTMIRPHVYDNFTIDDLKKHYKGRHSFLEEYQNMVDMDSQKITAGSTCNPNPASNHNHDEQRSGSDPIQVK